MKDYNLIKSCCFYVSSTHFTTMMLPHIKKSLGENKKIITFFEYNLKNNMDLLLSKTNLETNLIKNIKNIDWKYTNNFKYNNIEKKIKEENSKDIEILIGGGNPYIDLTNQMIRKYVNKNIKKIQDQRIKIINCFQVDEFNENIREILNEHDFYLNTAGEQKIEEVFGDIIKKEKID